MIRIVEINPLPNGAHRNQSGNFKNIPDGWAVIPDNITTENFPFGEIEAEEINGVMTVTKWTAGKAPRPFPTFEDETGTGVGEVEQLRADVDYIAIMTGVEL